jgi:hypothetical protein
MVPMRSCGELILAGRVVVESRDNAIEGDAMINAAIA